MRTDRISVGFLSLSVCVSLISNFAFGSNIGAVSRERDTSLTPSNLAFSIWGVIYSWIVVAIAYQVWYPLPVSPNVCMGISFLLSALWVPTFSSNTRLGILSSSVILVSAFSFALAAVLLSQGWKPPILRTLCVDAAFSLYTGWLLVASTLAVLISLKELGTQTFYLSYLFVPSLIAMGVAVPTKNPVLLLPLLWAVALQKDPPKIMQGVLLFLLLLAELVCTFLYSQTSQSSQSQKVDTMVQKQ